MKVDSFYRSWDNCGVPEPTWLFPNGKTLDEARPRDVRTLSNKELKRLRRFLFNMVDSHENGWLTPTQHWETFGIIDCITRVLAERATSLQLQPDVEEGRSAYKAELPFNLDEHGKYVGSSAGNEKMGDDHLIDFQTLRYGGVTRSHLTIGPFHIDNRSTIRVNVFPKHPRYNHATFQLVEFQWHAACFYLPVVQRLIWLGEPVTVHWRIQRKHTDWYDDMIKRDDRLTELPRTILLDATGQPRREDS